MYSCLHCRRLFRVTAKIQGDIIDSTTDELISVSHNAVLPWVIMLGDNRRTWFVPVWSRRVLHARQLAMYSILTRSLQLQICAKASFLCEAPADRHVQASWLLVAKALRDGRIEPRVAPREIR